MDEDYAAVDQRILEVIDLVRDEVGSCTAREVANRMHMSRNIVLHRCQKLKDLGLITWTKVPGSVRRITDHRQRLHDMLIVQGVALMAEGQGVAESEPEWMVVQWCRRALRDARSTAWPAPSDSVGPAQPAAEPASRADVPAEAGTPPANVCIVCDPDRVFPHAGAYQGHLKSKAHAQRAEQLAGAAT